MNVKIKHDKYSILSGILNKDDIKQLSTYFELLLKHQHLYGNVEEAPNSLGKYGDIVAESVQLDILPIIEAALQKQLFPTYGYIRQYTKGASLVPHLDRESSEYVCTLTINYDTTQPIWPIYIKVNQEDIPILLDEGELMVYRGLATKHWRDEYHGSFSRHIFLSFVDAKGEYKDYKYDKREQMMGKPNFRQVLKSRIHTLEHLPVLNTNTPIIATKILPYQIQKDGIIAKIIINKFRPVQFPIFLLAFVEELMEQTDTFQIAHFKNLPNEQFCLNILKDFIVRGFFDAI